MEPEAAMRRLVALAGLSLLAAGPGLAEPPSGWFGKLQAGGHLLTQDSGLVPGGTLDSDDSPGGLAISVSIMKTTGSRFAWGGGLSFEGNSVDVGPEFPGTGIQTFGIVPVRVTAQMEYWFLPRDGSRPAGTVPYLWAAAGWTANGVGTEVEWFGSASAGAPLALTLEDSPAVGVGFGAHFKSGSRFRFNAEVSYQWNAGDYTLYLEGERDRRGRFDLGGIYLMLGLTLG
jgi:hypothetical protein